MSEEEKQVNEAVEALKKENEEYLDSLKRLKAEFENYQKRVEKESTERAKFGSEDLILKLLKLIKIHKKIVNSVYSLKGNCTCKDYLDKNRDYDKKQKELLKKYGNPHIFSNFKPHITLGLIRGQNLEKIKEYLKKILKIGSFEVNNINIVKEENKNYELIKKFELK